MANDICRCGHCAGKHYVYILNGAEQGRCKDCDPMTNNRAQNYAMVSGSYEMEMYYAADHWFIAQSGMGELPPARKS